MAIAEDKLPGGLAGGCVGTGAGGCVWAPGAAYKTKKPPRISQGFFKRN
jgi:hypothetical protein